MSGLLLLGIERPAPPHWPTPGGGIVFLGIRPPIDVGNVRLLPKATAGIYETPLPDDVAPSPALMPIEIPDLAGYQAEPEKWNTVGGLMAWNHGNNCLTNIASFTHEGRLILSAFFVGNVLVFEHGLSRIALDFLDMPLDLTGVVLLGWNTNQLSIRFAYRDRQEVMHRGQLLAGFK